MRKLDCRSQIVGKIYNGIYVIQPLQKIKQNGRMFLFQCFCGEIFEHIGFLVKAGKVKSCGCIIKEFSIRKTDPYDEKISLRYRLSTYKHGASKRDLEWKLTDKQFKKLVKSNCYYCKAKPRFTTINKGQTYFYYAYLNGIDRKDNKKGYIKDNCVPCCKKCNTIKMDLTYEDFINHCILIANEVHL